MSDDTRKAQDDAAAMLLIDLAFLLPPGTDLQRITTLLIAYRHAVTAHTRDEDPSDLEKALRDLLDVIAADNLIPESVSYMRQARAALPQAFASAPPEKVCPKCGSPDRDLHPLTGRDDSEVRMCRDPWHGASASALSPSSSPSALQPTKGKDPS